MEEKTKRIVFKMYIRGYSASEIVEAPLEEIQNSERLNLEEIEKLLLDFENFLLFKYSVKGRKSLPILKEIENLEELERQSWVRKKIGSLIELKKIKVRLYEIIKLEKGNNQLGIEELFNYNETSLGLKNEN